MDTSTHSFTQNSHYGTKGPSSTSVRGGVSQEYHSDPLVEYYELLSGDTLV